MNKITFPDIETTAAAAQNSWVSSRRSAGATSEKLDDTQEELMVDYSALTETAKGLVRVAVQTTFEAIEHHGIPTGAEIDHICETAQERWIEARRTAGANSEKLDDTGEELMVPFAQLTDSSKELVRARVRTVVDMTSQANALERAAG